LCYGREIKYHHRSTAKYPVLDRNVVSSGFPPHMLWKQIVATGKNGTITFGIFLRSIYDKGIFT